MPAELTAKDLGLTEGLKEVVKEAGAIAGNQQQADNWITILDRVVGAMQHADSILGKFAQIKTDPKFQNNSVRQLSNLNNGQTPSNFKTMDKEPETEGQKELQRDIMIDNVKINYDMLFSILEEMRKGIEQDEKIKNMPIKEFIFSKLPANIKDKSVEEGIKFVLSNKFIAKSVIDGKFNQHKKTILKIEN